MNRSIFALIALTVATTSACGKVDATHPLDPDTPLDFQRTSQVAGRVIVPTGSDPASAAEVTIHLDPVSEGFVSRRGDVDTDGFFAIDDVIPGHYRLSAWGPGFSGGPVVVEVIRGTELELGSIPLAPVLGQVKGYVFTTTGRPATGAVVSADDGYEVTVVDTEGRFTLRVLEGERTVNIALPEHSPFSSETLIVEAWSEVSLSALVFLIPHFGQVIGQVALREFSTPARENRIQLVLEPVKAPDIVMIGEPMEAAPPIGGQPLMGGASSVTGEMDGTMPAAMPGPGAQQLFRDDREDRTDFNVDGDGSFALPAVEPGEYILHARAAGYDSQKRPLVVSPNQPVNIGRIDLAHTSSGPGGVRLDGRILTGGVGLVAIGVAVSIVSFDGSPLLPFRRIITDSNGAFFVAASPEEQYWLNAEVSGFPDIDSGPYQYFPGQGFIGPSGDPPNFVYGETR
ncbi:MAG: hypothetical protein VX589_05140 [Myxococcota bacterium]|nr:hypothetical protein [Myxococcota bacterium]